MLLTTPVPQLAIYKKRNENLNNSQQYSANLIQPLRCKYDTPLAVGI